MHMLWNHLPALESAITAGVAQHLPLAVLHEPFGPTAEIFPELAGGVTQISPSAIPDLNREHALLVGLGSRKISISLQDRIRRVAQQHSGTAALEHSERFRAAHAPILWMTVKPPDRTAHNQIEALAIIIGEIKRSCPDAGFLIDGASLPWDFASNSNYDGFFRDYLNEQVRLTERLISEVAARIDPKWRASVVPLAGVSACDEIVWSGIADFYFCHAGTPHHKIGWIHDTPGMIYSNSKFIAYYQWLKPLEKHPPIYYLPASLVADDPDANYGPEKLARKDQNFTLVSPRETAQRLLDAFRNSQPSWHRTCSAAAGDAAARPSVFEEISVLVLEQLGDTPPPQLADLWQHLHPVLLHQFEFNRDEIAIRSQQHSMIRDSCFLVPSPFGNLAETCDSSYFFYHRFFYQFAGAEEFFWITALLDRAYSLTTIYFPQRRVAVSLYPFSIDTHTLREFDALRAGITKPPKGTPIVVTGFPHYMHVLWNELPALEHATRSDLPERMRLAVMFEPFGPIAELFPEFAANLMFVRHDEQTKLNRDHRLLVGLGAWTISRATQGRVHRVAR